MSAARSESARLFLLCAVPALVFAAFTARTLDYGFVWTDRIEIVDGTLVLPPGEWHRAFTEPRVGDPASGGGWHYFRPLQVVVVSAIHAAFGETPRAYRLVSLLLGAVTAGLFSLWVWRLQGQVGQALFAGLLPVLHPAGIEAWVWIAGLSASMVALFIVAALACAVRWLREPDPSRSAPWLVGCLVAYAVALASKESAVILGPLLAAFVATDAVAGRAPVGRAIRVAGLAVSWRAVWLVAAIGAVGAVHIAVLRPLVLGVPPSATAIAGSRVTHVLTAVASWPGTLGWLAFPAESNASDVVRVVDGFGDPSLWLGALLPIVALLAWFALARGGLTTAAFGLAWIWIAFLPTSNLRPIIHATAERHVFLSTFGMALLLAEAGPALVRRLHAPRWAAALLAGLVLVGLGQRSWVRAPDWRSTQTLFERDVARDPAYREGRYWLAGLLVEQGRYAEATRHLEVLLEQLPQPEGRSSFLPGDPRPLLCEVKLRGEGPAAVERYVASLVRTHSRVAEAPPMQLCLARALEESGRPEGALAIYARLAAGPRPDPRLVLAQARCEARSGRASRARATLGRLPPSLRSDPSFAPELRRVEQLLDGVRDR